MQHAAEQSLIAAQDPDFTPAECALYCRLVDAVTSAFPEPSPADREPAPHVRDQTVEATCPTGRALGTLVSALVTNTGPAFHLLRSVCVLVSTRAAVLALSQRLHESAWARMTCCTKLHLMPSDAYVTFACPLAGRTCSIALAQRPLPIDPESSSLVIVVDLAPGADEFALTARARIAISHA